MKPRAIVLSGNACAGKSTLARSLQSVAGAELVRSKDLICQRLPNTGASRLAMQRAGDRLDKETGGSWISDALNKRLMSDSPPALVVVDAARITQQVRQPHRVDADHRSSSRIQAAHSLAALAGHLTVIAVAPRCSSIRMSAG